LFLLARGLDSPATLLFKRQILTFVAIGFRTPIAGFYGPLLTVVHWILLPVPNVFNPGSMVVRISNPRIENIKIGILAKYYSSWGHFINFNRSLGLPF